LLVLPFPVGIQCSLPALFWSVVPGFLDVIPTLLVSLTI